MWKHKDSFSRIWRYLSFNCCVIIKIKLYNMMIMMMMKTVMDKHDNTIVNLLHVLPCDQNASRCLPDISTPLHCRPVQGASIVSASSQTSSACRSSDSNTAVALQSPNPVHDVQVPVLSSSVCPVLLQGSDNLV